MRQDYAQFTQRDAEVIAIGPDGAKAFQDYWQKEKLPFVGLADPGHEVANAYRQEVSLLKLGRMPAVLIIDKNGQIQAQHYGSSMKDIPPNSQVLKLLDEVNRNS